MKIFSKNTLNKKNKWTSLVYWKRGLIIGNLFYLGLCVIPVLLCGLEFLKIIREGYEGAFWFLFFLGLPTTLFETLLEKYSSSFYSDIINLFVLTFINCNIIGVILGLIIGKRRNIVKVPKETSIKL